MDLLKVILAPFSQNRSSTKFPSTIVPYEPRLTREPPLRGLETRNVISPAMLGQGKSHNRTERESKGVGRDILISKSYF